MHESKTTTTMIDKINAAIDRGWRVSEDGFLGPKGEDVFQISISLDQLSLEPKEDHTLLNYLFLNMPTYIIECEGDQEMATNILCMDASVDLEVDLETVYETWHGNL